MADVGDGGKKGAPKIDMTPMVDMGFLLITFFMLSTTMSRPKAMDIQMPYKDKNLTQEQKNKIKESTALTVLLSKNHQIYYYEGMGQDAKNPPEVKRTTFKADGGIRAVVLEKRQKVKQLIAQGRLEADDKTTVLIKPDTNSTVNDLVNILDEMAIDAVPVYAVVDITKGDRDYIKEAREKLGNE